MKPEKETVSLTPMEQSLRGDKEEENFLEAAISSASHQFLTKVIRFGGRLAKSPYTIDQKFPVFPRKLQITEMLIREAHEKNLHGGAQLTLYTLRRTTWILSVVKGVLYRCKPCIRFDAKLLQPKMGDLPRKRVVPSFAFSHWGLDYCGPFYTKSWNSNAFWNYTLQFLFASVRRQFTSSQLCHWPRTIVLQPLKDLYLVEIFLMKYTATIQQLSWDQRRVGVSTSLSYSRVWRFDINVWQGEQYYLA